MYNDLTTDELLGWLLAESITDDAILASEDDWQAAQAFRDEVRDTVYARQFVDTVDGEYYYS